MPKRLPLFVIFGLLFSCTFVWGQEPRRGGFGGPGFPGRSPTADVNLLSIAEVRKELKISDEQAKKVDDLQQELQKQTQAAFEGFNFQDLQDMSPEERERAIRDRRDKVEAASKRIDADLQSLLDGTQNSRLSQLRLQQAGVTGMLRDEVAQRLQLDENQRTKLRELSSQTDRPFLPPDIRKKAETDALALLNDDQRETWRKMRGEEFKFPEMPFGPNQQQRQLVKQFDKDGDGHLNSDERKAAREFAKSNRSSGGPGGGPPGFGPPGFGPFGFGPPGFGPPGNRPMGGPPGRGREQEPTKPGPKVAVTDVAPINAPLYDPQVLRTWFLEFENNDWEAELSDFVRSDVDVPATLIVDGKRYPQVGVNLRGMSSLMAVREGQKRSLHLSMDAFDDKQRLQGYKTLNLLNSHEDPSFLHTVLYFEIARRYIPAPKANFVRLVINGESWGLYVNVQQFNKELIAENFPSTKGTRWKVPGSPGARGGLEYLGDDLEKYKTRYELKSSDGDKAWKRLAQFCKLLNQTPIEELERTISPVLDVDGTLWFLALENALINSDGYWIRASDYSIYLDEKGKFHILPHDANETFQPPMGPPGGGPGRGPGFPVLGGPGGGFGFGGPPGGGQNGRNYDLDPLIGMDDTSKPLRSRLLAVPRWKEQYLKNVRTIATEWLDWEKLGPLVNRHAKLISPEVEVDTRKLSSFVAFQQATSPMPLEDLQSRQAIHHLRTFADKRREFLLNYQAK